MPTLEHKYLPVRKTSPRQSVPKQAGTVPGQTLRELLFLEVQVVPATHPRRPRGAPATRVCHQQEGPRGASDHPTRVMNSPSGPLRMQVVSCILHHPRRGPGSERRAGTNTGSRAGWVLWSEPREVDSKGQPVSTCSRLAASRPLHGLLEEQRGV